MCVYMDVSCTVDTLLSANPLIENFKKASDDNWEIFDTRSTGSKKPWHRVEQKYCLTPYQR